MCESIVGKLFKLYPRVKFSYPLLNSFFSFQISNQLKDQIMMKTPLKAVLARPLIVCSLVMFFALPIVQVWADKADLSVTQSIIAGEPLRITLGKAELVQVSGNVSDVLVANSDIVNVQAVQSDRLYVVGMNVGDTNIIALDENGDVIEKIDIHVTYDLKAINGFVKKMFPKEDVTVDVLHDQIMLTGTASTPEVASKIAGIVGQYAGDLQEIEGTTDELISNLLEVRGEQQVMLQVRVVEASRSFVRELGINTLANDQDENAVFSIFGNAPAASQRGGAAAFLSRVGDGVALPNDPAGSFAFLSDSGIPGIGQLGLFIDALEREDLVTVLAEPNLTAISGQQAGFLGGGEFPVPTGRDRDGNIIIEYREFGVSLNFRPVVLSDERINLQLNTEVSSLDFVNSVGAGDLVVPGLDIRRAETTIEIPSGGTIMIAGLLQSDAVEGLGGLPGVRNAPILGDLISSKSFQRNETELVVLVTAYKVEPFADTSRSQPIPKQEDNPLAKSFAVNIRNRYTDVDSELFNDDQKFGYILD